MAKTLGVVSLHTGDTTIPKCIADQQPSDLKLVLLVRLQMCHGVRTVAVWEMGGFSAVTYPVKNDNCSLLKSFGKKFIVSCAYFVCAITELFCVKTRLSIKNYMFYNNL